MRENSRTLILGVGSMGEAILKGLIGSKNFPISELGIVGRNAERLNRIAATYGVDFFLAGSDAVGASDAIVLCCKPHDLDQVASQIKPALSKAAVVISTLAGVAIADIQEKLSHARVARLIPNIAASLNAGVTVWTAADTLPADQLDRVRRLVESLGQSIEVEDEKYVELATPLGGAGPALVAFFVESLIDSSVHMGIPRALSTTLVAHTIAGSMHLIASGGESPSDVRARVTSPGGLTAECIATLERHGFRTAVLQAMLAGLRKTYELKQRSGTRPDVNYARGDTPQTSPLHLTMEIR